MKTHIILLGVLSAARFTLSLPVTARDLAGRQDLFQRDPGSHGGAVDNRAPADILYEAIEKREPNRYQGIVKKNPSPEAEAEPDPQGNWSQGLSKKDALPEAEPEPQGTRPQAISKKDALAEAEPEPDNRYQGIAKKGALPEAEPEPYRFSGSQRARRKAEPDPQNRGQAIS
jgi:hypothetical protein